MNRGDARRRRRAVRVLLGGNALTMMGVGFVLPMLPLLLARRGGSPFFVGVVFASGVAVRAAAQYPAGWAADRIGPRRVIVTALLLYGLAFPLYALPMAPGYLVLLRCAQAVAGGAYFPAAAALLGGLVDEPERGRAFGQLRSSDMFGLLVGPALGGVVARFSIGAVFVGAGTVCLLSAAVMLQLPHGSAQSVPAVPDCDGGTPVCLRSLLWALAPIVALGVPCYWWAGTFDAVWSLYLSARGATPAMVGLSFAVFAVPVVLLSGRAGRLADRFGYAPVAGAAVLAYGALATGYVFVATVPVLLAMLVVEGTLAAGGSPALSAEVSRVAPAGSHGRTQALYQAALLVSQVGGSLAGGALFGSGRSLPFLAAATICAIGVATSAALRHQVAATAGWRARLANRHPNSPWLEVGNEGHVAEVRRAT